MHVPTLRPGPRWAMRGRPWLAPGLVLLVGATLSVVLSRTASDELCRNAHLRFDNDASHAAGQVEKRFAAYVEVLSGLRALFHTGDVSADAFRRYGEALNLQDEFPGFQVLNYAPYVASQDRAAFEAGQRAKGLPRYAIQPMGERAGYHPFTLIEPLSGNEQYLGKDIAANPAVRASLAQARDTGRLSASGKVIQNRGPHGEVGLAMRLPVYTAGVPVDTLEQRRVAYRGSVGAGFLVKDMFAGLPGVGNGLRLRLYDGGGETATPTIAPPVPAAESLLFDTQAATPQQGPQPGAKPVRADERPPLRHVQAFSLGGRQWLIEVTGPRGQHMGAWERQLPDIILAGGLVITVLVAGVLLSVMGAQRRAVALAHGMTKSLRNSEQRLAEAQSLARLGSWVLDARSGEVEVTEEARRIYGLGTGTTPFTLPRLLALVPEGQRADVQAAIDQAWQQEAGVEVEHGLRAADGQDRWLHMNLRRTGDAGVPAQLNATVRDDTARRRAVLRQELAHAIARTLAADGDPHGSVAQVLAAIGERMDWQAAVCWRLEGDGLVHCMRTWAPEHDAQAQTFVSAMQLWSGPRAGCALDAAWTTGNPLWRAVAANDSHCQSRDRVAAGCQFQAALVIPVQAGSERLALEFFSRSPVGVDREIENLMRSIASQLAQYLQRKQAEDALRRLACHDPLTGLANRPLLQQRMAGAIEHAQQSHQGFAVLFLDLDRFKHVNDSLGHSAGDVLLRECARRLRDCVRASDTVARFGGDEFVVVLDNVSASEDVLAPLGKILHRLAQPYEVDGRELHSTASIGVSLYPQDGQDPESLLMHADTAMYRAKDKGAGSYDFYAAQANGQAAQRLTMESALRRALERDELFMVYQPKLDLTTATVTGVEALMRWQHPVLGLVSPAQFIPIAEDTGLIEAFGHWALEVACRDARRWQDEGHPVQVSVNLSARQLNRAELVQDVSSILARARLAPSSLELEITESAVMRNPTRAALQLRELRSLGVSLAIDDFGTGYSSLSYLRRFPLGTLKIDRSFIKDLPQDEDAAALTGGIIGLAQRLRMKVVAEGVETLEQVAFLRASRCDQIQGYYLSKPLTAQEMSRFLTRDVRNLLSPTVAA